MQKLPSSLVPFLGAVAATLPLIATPAHAQGTVTLYGILDSAMRYVHNDAVGSIRSLVSGSGMTSRLGVRGVEDLGGGLTASFNLEHGVLVDSGTQASASQFWDRRAIVAIADKQLGEVRLGRDYTPNFTNWARFDPFGYTGAASAGNLINTTAVGPVRSAFGTGLAPTVRSSNAVQYVLPGGLGGVEGVVMVAAGEGGLSANAQHKLISARLGYTAPTFEISVVHAQIENDLTTAGKLKDSGIGGTVSLAGAKFSGALRVFKYADAKQLLMLLSAVVPLGVAGELKFSINRAKFDGRVGATSIDGNASTQLAMGYVHSLSKRTALYTTASWITNKGRAAAVVPGGPPGLPAGGDSKGCEAGLRHSF